MKKTNFRFNVAFFVCAFVLSGSVRANDNVLSIQEQIKGYAAQGSLSNLVAVEAAIEPLWTNAPVFYFQLNDQLIGALESLSEKQPKALQEYEKQSCWTLNRKCPTNPPQATVCFNTKFQIATRLVGTQNPSMSNALALAGFLGEVRTTMITNYHRAIVYMNVDPPLTPTNANGMGYFSGMDPAVISDPVARAAYEKAIEENGHRGEINDFYINTLPEINRTMAFHFFYYISALSAKETLTKKQVGVLAEAAHLTKMEVEKLKGKSN